MDPVVGNPEVTIAGTTDAVSLVLRGSPPRFTEDVDRASAEPQFMVEVQPFPSPCAADVDLDCP